MKYRNLGKISKTKKNNAESREVRHSKKNALTENEFSLLLSASDDIIDQLYIVATGLEGMRESEIAHMNETWVDFQSKTKTITIPEKQECDCSSCIGKAKAKALKNGKSKEEIDSITTAFWTPKTKKGARKIPLRKTALPIFVKYFGAFHKVGKSRQTIWKHISAIAKKTTITKEVYPHSLRATAATFWASMGVPAPILQSIMGWENIETANEYVEVDMDTAVREAKYWEEQYEGRVI